MVGDLDGVRVCVKGEQTLSAGSGCENDRAATRDSSQSGSAHFGSTVSTSEYDRWRFSLARCAGLNERPWE